MDEKNYTQHCVITQILSNGLSNPIFKNKMVKKFLRDFFLFPLKLS